jgi:hypothetical protein
LCALQRPLIEAGDDIIGTTTSLDNFSKAVHTKRKYTNDQRRVSTREPHHGSGDEEAGSSDIKGKKQ